MSVQKKSDQMRDGDLLTFTPYLLSMALEQTSEDFMKIYRDHYGMQRTEWKVLFHLGEFGDMSAKEISIRARLHKTKISRAVSALEQKRFLQRTQSETDRRSEILSLRPAGMSAYRYLADAAKSYEELIERKLGKELFDQLHESLLKLSE